MQKSAIGSLCCAPFTLIPPMAQQLHRLKPSPPQAPICSVPGRKWLRGGQRAAAGTSGAHTHPRRREPAVTHEAFLPPRAARAQRARAAIHHLDRYRARGWRMPRRRRPCAVPSPPPRRGCSRSRRRPWAGPALMVTSRSRGHVPPRAPRPSPAACSRAAPPRASRARRRLTDTRLPSATAEQTKYALAMVYYPLSRGSRRRPQRPRGRQSTL